MRILLAADLHYSLRQWDWLCRAAGKFDVVVHAGDFLDVAATVDLDVQILVTLKYLRRLQPESQILAASGNHDLDREGPSGEREAGWMNRARRLGIQVDGDSLDRDGYRITVFPWWEGPAGRTSVVEQMQLSQPPPGTGWIWAYHAPPTQTPVSWTGKEWFGDAYLGEWIERFRPLMVLTGHVHHAPFSKGGSWAHRQHGAWVFNAGRQIGPWPAHVRIDLDRQLATWVSLAGEETRELKEDAGDPKTALSRTG
ncbi:MAG TPA: metallophosphoesterase [Verrucomicrobiales bacterium]|nr:metallophosphoesterase [Verrucomicrobiales bacterium]